MVCSWDRMSNNVLNNMEKCTKLESQLVALPFPLFHLFFYELASKWVCTENVSLLLFLHLHSIFRGCFDPLWQKNCFLGIRHVILAFFWKLNTYVKKIKLKILSVSLLKSFWIRRRWKIVDRKWANLLH